VQHTKIKLTLKCLAFELRGSFLLITYAKQAHEFNYLRCVAKRCKELVEMRRSSEMQLKSV